MNTKIINESGAVEDLFNQLKNLKINRFHSIYDIIDFKNNYQIEIKNYKNQIMFEIKNEIETLYLEKETLLEKYNVNKETQIAKISNKLHKYESIINNSKKNIFSKIYCFFIRTNLNLITKNYDKIIEKPIKRYLSKINKCDHRISYLTANQIDETESRSKDYIKNINYIVNVLQNLTPLIYGGIGELKAINLFKKLPVDYYIINNYCRTFNPPLFNKNEKDRIFSTQIDHIVIGPTGVYVIETKYWSKRSIDSIDLFSPIKQLRRSGYAIFVVLNSLINSDRNSVFSNHWGNTKISVSNILLMMNSITNEQFQFVKVLSESNFINYITKRPIILSNDQIQYLVNKLT